MEYNFDTPTHRRGTNSYKWDSSPDNGMLPMWVADMDFKTAPCIIEALKERVDHGIFGYTRVPDEYYDAVTGWFSRRHGWKIESDWILYTSGVVPAVSAVIKGLTSPGKKIVTLTPAYNCFFSSIRNNGCLLASCPLKYEDNRFYIDFDCLETLLADPDATILLLCNPHNPSGRVWTKEELLRIGHLCLKHGVMVVSDEIHCELVHPGHEYTPFASLAKEFSENCVTCVSPSKAFNIAGLQIASIITENNDWRQRIDRAININEVCDVNPFGVIATIAAYNKGEEWLTHQLSLPEGLLRRPPAAATDSSARRNLSGMDGLPEPQHSVGKDGRGDEEGSEALAQRRNHVWQRGRGIHEMEPCLHTADSGGGTEQIPKVYRQSGISIESEPGHTITPYPA